MAVHSGDSIVVYGPTTFTKVSSFPEIMDDYFSITVVPGRRYLVEARSVGLTQFIFSLNGQQWIGSQEGSCVRRLIVASSNSVDLALYGSAGGHVTIKIVHVPDPTFEVFGPRTYTGDSTDAFTLPEGADALHTLWVINGAPGGTNRVTSATVKLNGTSILTGSDFGSGIATITRTVTLLATDSIVVSNMTPGGSYFSLRFASTDTLAPTLLISQPADSLVTANDTVLVVGTVLDSTFTDVTVAGEAVTVGTDGSFAGQAVFTSDGAHTVNVTAVDAAGNQSEATRTIIRDTTAPSLVLDESAVVDSFGVISGSWLDATWCIATVDDEDVGSGDSASVYYSEYPLDLGQNRVTIRVTDAAGNQTQQTQFVFREAPDEPDAPTLSAPALDATIVSTFLDQVSFLYADDPPIQQGVHEDSIDAARASVLRGYVRGRDYGGLANVTVRVLARPEYGYTTTREDGAFDMVVNGGGPLVVRFTKPGYLEGQRRVEPGLNQYVIVDSMAMIGRSAIATAVDLSTDMIVRSRFKTDGNGDRNVHLFFSAGTEVDIIPEAGDTTTVTDEVTVRMTEYTVGPDGEMAMPGILPPTTAYTYCVDLRLDEADALWIGGEPEPRVEFSKPVVKYVDNFLNFPAGTCVPVGTYDPWAGLWKGEQDACVIKVLTVGVDTVTIDSDGDGEADTQGRLDSLQVSDAELTALASAYAPGDVVWRSMIRHFSPLDDNINMDLVIAQQSLGAGRAGQPMGLVEESTICQGCVVEVENRVLGEEIPIVGTPYSLHYRSFRMPGDRAMRTLRIQVSGDSVPPDVTQIIARLDVAGKRYEWSQSGNSQSLKKLIAVIPDWDGTDAFGRPVQGSVEADVAIGYRYSTSWRAGGGGTAATAGSWSDARNSGASLGASVGDRTDRTIRWTRRKVSLGVPQATSAALGGWTISPHHFYDTNGRGALYLGDGTVDLGERTYPVLTTAISNVAAADVAVAPDGTVYVAGPYTIDRFIDGVYAGRVAGQNNPGSYIDNVPGTSTPLTSPERMAIAPDGTLYFVMESEASCNCQRVVKIDSTGYVRSVAGDGERHTEGPIGDGGLADTAGFRVPKSLAIGPDGSLYVGDRETYSVRRIGPNGYINLYAGNGVQTSSFTDGVATEVPIVQPRGLSVDNAGNLYIVGGKTLQRVTPDGYLTTLLHDVSTWFHVNDVVAAPDGAVYLATGAIGNSESVDRVQRLDPDGTLTVIAGGGPPNSPQYADEGIPALGARLGDPSAIDIEADGSILVGQGIVKRIAPPSLGATLDTLFMPSPRGDEIYAFNLGGRHLQTRDALTGAVRHSFTYDGAGRLATVTDVDGLVTTITRDGGAPTKITGPYGHETLLTLDGGFLKSVTNPMSEVVTLTYRPDGSGLLTKTTDALAREHLFDFTSSDGRLDEEEDPEGGTQSFELAASGFSRTVTRTTGLGRESAFTVTDLYDGTRQRRIIGQDGLLTYSSDSVNASRRSWFPAGMSVEESLAVEPRFGLLRPMSQRVRERLWTGGSPSAERTTRVTRGYTPSHPSPSGFNPPSIHGRVLTTATRPGKPSATHTFASDSLLHRFVTPVGRKVEVSVDHAGRPLALVVPGQATTTFAYDIFGRDSLVEHGGRGLRFSYDDSGRVAVIRDTLGRMNRFTYDHADRLTEQILPGGRAVSFGYDAVGNLTRLTPPGQPGHGFDYTGVDLTERYRPPGAGLGDSLTLYLYNADEQLTGVERPDNTDITLDYHSTIGRLETITIPRGAIGFAYDSQGRLSAMTSPDTVTVTYGYAGPVPISETWSGRVAGSVAVMLNSDFQIESQSVNGGNSVTYAYDDDDLLTDAGALTIDRRSDNGLISGTTLGNVTTEESQNHVGEPWQTTARYDGTTLWKATYARDSLGRITGITETVEGVTLARGYGYATDSSVVAAGADSGFLSLVTVNGTVTERYAYDGNGNRLRFESDSVVIDTATASYDEQDRLLRYGNTAYAYTASGELSRAITGTDTTLYHYDPLGNLILVHLEDGAMVDTLEYRVDGRNRRVARILNHVTTHQWLYQDQLEPVAELDSAGALVSRFVYGSRPHVPDYMVQFDGDSVYRIIADHLGSVRLVVNVVNGFVAQRMDFDAFGRQLNDTNPGFQPFGFAGGLSDTLTSLVRLGARDFDPAVGRWTRRDPKWMIFSSVGRYVYAMNDPMNRIDVDGREAAYVAYGRYRYGSGDPVSVPFDEVDPGLQPADFPGFDEKIAKAGENIFSPVYIAEVRDVGENYGNVRFTLRGSIYMTGGGDWCFEGEIYAIPDFYDFQWEPFGSRDKEGFPVKELATRFAGRGTPYTVSFEGSRRVSAAGRR